MTTTLSEGVKIPDIGSVNWGADLEINWYLLNGALANLSANVRLNADNTWTGTQTFLLPIEGSITGTASKAIADEDGTSIKTGYVNVAGNQTVSGDKSWTGSNTFNNILPNATNTYSLGSSSYQWSSVYAQTYYYNGTAWGLDKSNTWSNVNYFNRTLFCDYASLASKTVPSEYIQDPLIIVEGDTYPKTWHGGIALERYTNGDEGFQFLTCSYVNGATQQLGALRYLVSGDGTSVTLFSRGPANNHLGTSTNKWTTLNGVNPGALSLPDMGSYLDFSSSITNFDGTHNFYTPPVDGWMTVVTAGTALDLFEDNGQNDPRYQGSAASSTAVQGYCFCTIPVHKNVRVRIRVIGTSVYMAHVRPCLGNV